MNAWNLSFLRRVHLVIDAAVIVGAMLCAASLQQVLQPLVPLLKDLPSFSEHAVLAYLALPLYLWLIFVLGLHRSFELVYQHSKLIVALLKVNLLGLVGLSVIQFLTHSVINRSLVILFCLCIFGMMYLQRVLLGMLLRLRHHRGHKRSLMLLVGHPSARMRRFVDHVARCDLSPLIVGYLGPSRPLGVVEPATNGHGPAFRRTPRRLGAVGDLERVLHEHCIDHVVFFRPCDRPESAADSLRLCEERGVPASFPVELTRRTRVAPRVTMQWGYPFVTFEADHKSSEWLSVKHSVDAVLAAVLLVVLAPLLLLISLAILVTMGRPVFFVQTRAGLFGRPFRMVKFRSMVRDAEARKAEVEASNEMCGPVFKTRNDPRVTTLGRILRATSVDELPQLFNVVTGTMSLVGPRPLPVSEQNCIYGSQARRLSMKPGITGLWQVLGRSDVDFADWMALDQEYVDNWSLLLDARILLRTIPVVLLRKGAS